MKVGRALTLAAVCLLSSACYRQVVQTGGTPGPIVVSKPWTATWLWGLVPATPIDVTQQCANGMATVVTELTVPNAIATLLTVGIYAPRSVTVTCATGTALRGTIPQFHIAAAASRAERDAVFAAAVEASARTKQPVLIRF